MTTLLYGLVRVAEILTVGKRTEWNFFFSFSLSGNICNTDVLCVLAPNFSSLVTEVFCQKHLLVSDNVMHRRFHWQTYVWERDKVGLDSSPRTESLSETVVKRHTHPDHPLGLHFSLPISNLTFHLNSHHYRHQLGYT